VLDTLKEMVRLATETEPEVDTDIDIDEDEIDIDEDEPAEYDEPAPRRCIVINIPLEP
jgi:hypothetical protein